MGLSYQKDMLKVLLKVQRYSYPENIDLYHYTVILKRLYKDEGVQTAATKIQKAEDKAIVANASVTDSMENSYGLAIYLPWDFTVEYQYKKLAFARKTLWDDMIVDLKKKRSVYELATSLEEGDVSELRTFAANSKKADPELVRFVAQQLNFRLFSEGGFSRETVKEAAPLVRSLFTR